GALDATMAARQAAVVVAVAPWVMLVLALWLWLLMIKHVQAGRETSYREEYLPEYDDIVPFQRTGGEPEDGRERGRERPADRSAPDAVSLAAAFPSPAEAAAAEPSTGPKAADAEPARSGP